MSFLQRINKELPLKSYQKMLILLYLVCTLEMIAVWKNQIEILDTFFVIWVEITAKIYGQPLGFVLMIELFIKEEISPTHTPV